MCVEWRKMQKTLYYLHTVFMSLTCTIWSPLQFVYASMATYDLISLNRLYKLIRVTISIMFQVETGDLNARYCLLIL